MLIITPIPLPFDLSVSSVKSEGLAARCKPFRSRPLSRSITIGSVYATLDRLEAKELVGSWRSRASAVSVSRRLFTVTSAGARSLALTRDTRERLWNGVSLQALGLSH